MHSKNNTPFKLTLSLISLFSVSLMLISCGNSEDAQKLKNALELNKLNITSLELTSPNTIVEFDATEQFIAKAFIGDDIAASLDISDKVTWSVSNTDSASISSSGLLTGKADGLVTVTIQLADLSATKDLDLSSATLTAINITNKPSPVSVCKADYELTAEGTYSDTTIRDISSLVSWSSDDPNTLSIDETGSFSTFKNGTATITATRSSVSGADTISIDDDIASILISSATDEVNIGRTLAFTAQGTYDDTSTADITNTVTWASDDTATLTISNDSNTKGVTTGIAVGSANISANCLTTVPTASNSTEVTVSLAPVIDDIAINEGNENLEFKINDSPEQLTARLQFSDNTFSTDVTDDDDTIWSIVRVVSGTGLEVSNVKGSKGEITFTGTGITIISVRYDDSDDELGQFDDEIEVEIIEN